MRSAKVAGYSETYLADGYCDWMGVPSSQVPIQLPTPQIAL